MLSVSDAPLFTVFTPTYNRAHTLHRVYDSLRAQTLRDFEWLVVDDDSTDDTSGLIAQWIKAADFPIRHFRQAHSGKHFAHNLAVREARGKMFTPLDSDDACPPNTLKRMMHWWNTIPPDQRESFCGVTGISNDQYGNLVGRGFPSQPLDATMRELRYVHHVWGEKGICWLTDILRGYPFPEVARGEYLPEGIVWLDVAKRFKTRAVNEVFRIYYMDDAETGASISKRASLKSHALGRWYFYIWFLNNDLGYFFNSPIPFIKAAILLPALSWISNRSSRAALSSLQSWSARALVCMALPFSSMLYAAHKIRRR